MIESVKGMRGSCLLNYIVLYTTKKFLYLEAVDQKCNL